MPWLGDNTLPVRVDPMGTTTQPVSLSSLPSGVNSLSNSTGKTNVLRTGSLTTTLTTADQVVLTYTVTAGKTLFLQYFTLMARLTALSATASVLGTMSVETPSGTKVFTTSFTNPTVSLIRPTVIVVAEPIPIPAGTVLRMVCTPAAVSSMLWIANFGGFEK